MLRVVTSADFRKYKSEMDEAFQLLKTLPKNRRKMRITRCAEIAADQFDAESAVHMIYLESDRVVGYQRMLPSTSAHARPGDASPLFQRSGPVGTHIWEWSHHLSADSEAPIEKLGKVSIALIEGFVEWGLRNDVSSVLTEMNSIWLFPLLQLLFKVTPLGLPHIIGGEEVVPSFVDCVQSCVAGPPRAKAV